MFPIFHGTNQLVFVLKKEPFTTIQTAFFLLKGSLVSISLAGIMTSCCHYDKLS